jgi:protein Mpv17
MDVDEVINSLAIVATLVGVGVLLYQIDASVPHTEAASLKDLATRIPLEAFHNYEGFIRESPIATKAVTSATVYTIGDFISQRAEGISVGQLDRPRILRSLLAGLIGHGPLSHFWYTYLDQ